MGGPNGQGISPAQPPPEIPKVERAPVDMAVDFENATYNGQRWVRITFKTATGESTYWLTPPQAQAAARVLLELAGGLVLPS